MWILNFWHKKHHNDKIYMHQNFTKFKTIAQLHPWKWPLILESTWEEKFGKFQYQIVMVAFKDGKWIKINLKKTTKINLVCDLEQNLFMN